MKLYNADGRVLTLNEAKQERAQLKGEADEILTRSGGEHIEGDEAERYDSILNRAKDIAEYVSEVESSMNRMADLVDRGSIEAGTPPVRHRMVEASTPKPLAGTQTLTRDQSVTDWSRDNGHMHSEPASFDKFIRGIASGDWRGAALERSLAEGTQSAGGWLVPTPLASNVIDIARNSARVIQAGAQTVPMQAQTLKIPRLTGEGAPAWRNENAAVAQGDLTFDAVTLTAKSLTRLVLVSRELFEDSDPSVSDVIAQSFGQQIALELDRAALRGTGTAPEPRGVLNTSGVTITNHGANGGAPSYDWLLDAMLAVRGNNYEPNAIIGAPRLLNSLGKLKDTTGQYLSTPAGMLPILPTKQIPVNLTVGTNVDNSEVYTAQWNLLAIGIRTSFSLEIIRERWIDNLQVGFLATLRADVAVLQPGAFAVDLGVRA